MPRLHPVGVTVAAALAMLGVAIGGLPFWWAMAILLVWLLFAASEVTIWFLTLRTERRRHDVRNLIERELASMPLRETLQYPTAWEPFIDRHAQRCHGLIVEAGVVECDCRDRRSAGAENVCGFQVDFPRAVRHAGR